MADHLRDDDLIRLADARQSPPVHVTECARCAARLREFERTLELAAAAPPQMAWNSLQSGSFMHRVRRGIEQRHQPRAAAWWQPALAGAALTLVAVLAIRQFAPAEILLTPSHDTGPQQTPAQALVSYEQRGGQDVTDDELLSMIDSYLIDTASEDELLMTLDELSDDDMVAALGL